MAAFIINFFWQEIGNLSFDKDDQLAVEFVTAAANIRAASFGIPLHSLFEAKGIAGNIVHAVATTNAIIAGLIVIEAIKVLQSDAKNYRWGLISSPLFGVCFPFPVTFGMSNISAYILSNMVEIICEAVFYLFPGSFCSGIADKCAIILSECLCRMTYCLEHPSRKMLLMPVEPFEPNKSCYVCSEVFLVFYFDLVNFLLCLSFEP